MRGVLHFLLLAGATFGSIQLAIMALDAIGVTMAPGIGLDDILEALIVALGVSLTMTLAKTLLKAA